MAQGLFCLVEYSVEFSSHHASWYFLRGAFWVAVLFVFCVELIVALQAGVVWEGCTALLKTVFLTCTPYSFPLGFDSSISFLCSVSFSHSVTISDFSFEILRHFVLNLFLCIYFACLGVLNSGPWTSCSLCSWFPRQERHVLYLSTRAFVCFVWFGLVSSFVFFSPQ